MTPIIEIVDANDSHRLLRRGARASRIPGMKHRPIVSPGRRRFASIASSLCAMPLLLAHGCSSYAPPLATIEIDGPELPQLLPLPLAEFAAGRAEFDFVLLGEVHDNPLHHRLRRQWLDEIARHRPFVLAMEQFDADRQPDIDRARAGGVPARALAEAAGFQFQGWDWELYGPFVDLALRFDLPLVGANLSTAQARGIARGGAHPMSGITPPDWTREDAELQANDIRDGHCGMLPASAIPPMSAAQRARDATMAKAITDARRGSGLPVVLLAGNGHVRDDLGVPRYLRGRVPPARTLTVGIVERGGDEQAGQGGGARDETFDLRIRTPRHPRPDPCEVFRRRAPARA
jgi:uncharacterized iron-regulated protein